MEEVINILKDELASRNTFYQKDTLNIKVKKVLKLIEILEKENSKPIINQELCNRKEEPRGSRERWKGIRKILRRKTNSVSTKRQSQPI